MLNKLYKLTYAGSWRSLVDAAGLGLYGPAAGLVLADCGFNPIFFCLAFQWVYIPVRRWFPTARRSSSQTTSKQSVLGWTQYALTKDKEFKRKAVLYSNTVLMFFLGALLGGHRCSYLRQRTRCLRRFIPLAVALGSLSASVNFR